MGVFTRPDSKWYWLFLERAGRKGLKERTNIPKTADLALAEKLYHARLTELATHPEPKRKTLRADGSGWCYIYFVSDGHAIKIGRAVNVLARVRAMQTASLRPLIVLATFNGHISLERQLHRHFAHLHLGREWFEPKDDLLQTIEAIKSGRDPVAMLVNSAMNFAQSVPAPNVK